jgi:hypothetical protein
MIIFGVVCCPMGFVLYGKIQARSAKENKFAILDSGQTVAFDGKNFEVVNEFGYLGALVTLKNDVGLENPAKNPNCKKLLLK